MKLNSKVIGLAEEISSPDKSEAWAWLLLTALIQFYDERKQQVENKEIKTVNIVDRKGRSKLKVMDKENADTKASVFAKAISPVKEKLLALLGALRKTAWSNTSSIKHSHL